MEAVSTDARNGVGRGSVAVHTTQHMAE